MLLVSAQYNTFFTVGHVMSLFNNYSYVMSHTMHTSCLLMHKLMIFFVTISNHGMA